MAKHSDKPAEPENGEAGGKKKRGCLRRLFKVGAVVLLVLLWVLNGPGFRWGAEYGIGKAMAGQGMEGSVEVGGTLWGGPVIEGMAYSGGELLPTLKVGRAAVDYDVIGLIRDGGLGWLKRVELTDVQVEVVLPEGEEGEPEEVAEEPAEAGDGGGMDALWDLAGLELAIENVNVRVVQGEKVTVIEGLTLTQDGRGQGRLGLGKLELPSGEGRGGIETGIEFANDSLSLGPLRVFDTVEVTSLTMYREPAVDEALFAAELALSGGRLRAEATADLALSLVLEEGAIDVPPLLAIAEVEGLQSALVDVLEVHFVGDFAKPSTWNGNVAVGVSDAAWAPATVDRVVLGAELKGGPAAVTLHAERAGAVVDVRAQTDLSAVDATAALADVAAEVEVAIEVEDVAPLIADYVEDAAETLPVSGALKADANARVEAKALAGATVRVLSDSLAYGETGVGEVAIEARTDDGEVIAAKVGVIVDEGTAVEVDGTFDVPTKAYAGEAQVTAGLAGRFRDLLGEFGVTNQLEGDAVIAWSGSGELEPAVHRGEATVALDGGRVDEGIGFDVDLEASYEGTEVEVGAFTVVSEELTFEGGLTFAENVLEVSPIAVRDPDREIVSGRVLVPLDLATVKSAGDFFAQPGELQVVLKSEALPLASLMRLAGQEPPVTGVLNVDVDVRGPPRALAGKGLLEVAGVGPVGGGGDIPPADVTLEFEIADAALGVKGSVRHPDLQPLEVTAALPFLPEAWATGERTVTDEALEARVVMAPSDVGFAKRYAPVIEVIEGTVGVDVAVSGTVGAPVPTGTAGFELSEVRVGNPNVPSIKDAVVRLRFADRVVDIEAFEAVVAGGEIGLDGKVGFPPEGGGPEFDLALTGRQALVMRNDMLSVRMNIDLALRGPWEAAAISGKLGVTESLFFKNFDLLPVRVPRRGKSALPEVEKTPSAPMPRSIEVGVDAEPFRDWTVDVQLVTDDPFLVRSNLAETAVRADLKVSGRLEAPVPDGRVWLDEGLVKLPFSEIQVQEGAVVFSEETGFNPALEFRVVAEASEYKVTGYVYNRALDPKWVLTSNPPLPQEDILTLLGTGTTRSGLAGSGQGELAKMAGAYVWKAMKKEKAVESREPTFFDELADRSKINVEDIDLKTGELTLGGKIRLWEQLYLTGKVGQAGTYRAMLKYLFRFK